MTRLLLALAIAFLLVWWFRRDKRSDSNPKTTPPQPQALIACAHCGIMIPESESFLDPHQRRYCSAEHLRLANPPSSND